MRKILQIYGINALSFLLNVGSVFIYLRLSGAAGYGAYSVYAICMSTYSLFDISLVKACVSIFEKTSTSFGPQQALARAHGLLQRYMFILVLMLAITALGASFAFPTDPATKVGGVFVSIIVFLESILATPFNALSLQWALEKRFSAIYAGRLYGSLLRHLLAWSVLFVTGSIYLALASVIIRGAIIGFVSQRLRLNTNNAIQRTDIIAPKMEDYYLLLSIFGSVIVIAALKETPSVYLNRHFGQEIFGQFRAIYDLINPIWFIATIYPTVLFAHLLPKGGKLEPQEATAKFVPLSLQVALFHLCFGAGVFFIISLGRVETNLIYLHADFIWGVVAGVCLMGYNSFLIEACHAFGYAGAALRSLVLALVVVVLYFALGAQSGSGAPIGIGWMLGQIVLFIALKLILFSGALRVTPGTLADIALLAMPLLGLAAMADFSPFASFAPSSFVVAAASGIALLVLLRRNLGRSVRQ